MSKGDTAIEDLQARLSGVRVHPTALQSSSGGDAKAEAQEVNHALREFIRGAFREVLIVEGGKERRVKGGDK